MSTELTSPLRFTSRRFPMRCFSLTAGVLLSVGLLSGCSAQNGEQATAESTSAPSDVPQETSWSEQLAQVRGGERSRIELRETTVTDAELLQLKAEDNLRALNLDHAQVTNEGLAQLASVTSLVRLKLREAPVDDRGLELIAQLENLETLNLPHARCTDAGLAHLAALPKLSMLRFGSGQVTDAGMTAIKNLRSLRALHLIEIPITDVGLAEIAQMDWLESFYLDGGKATDAGFRHLLDSLPELHFHLDQQHLDYDPNRHHH